MGSASPAVVNERVYIYSGDVFYCLNDTMGESIWQYKRGFAAFGGSPIVAKDQVITPIYNAICRLDANTGELIEEYTVSSWIGSPPVVANKKIYVGDWNGYLYCFG